MQKKFIGVMLMAIFAVATFAQSKNSVGESEIYNFVVKNQADEDVSLSEYKGQVLLIVNTATRCGFTPQYKDLQAMYAELKDSGFSILDFPCNQFANQAPGTDEEISAFCETRFGVTFPQFSKIEVNGDDAIPLYKWLVKNSDGKKIKWNFTKFLIDRNGNIVKRYESATPIKKIRSDLEALL